MTRSTGLTTAQRLVVFNRDLWCLRCHRQGVQIHHRKPRKIGGTRRPEINYPSNTVLLCLSCHEWIESFRSLARQTGWLVSDWDDPARITLTNVYGDIFRLDDDGHILRAAS